jgi:hypothetical protein
LRTPLIVHLLGDFFKRRLFRLTELLFSIDGLLEEFGRFGGGSARAQGAFELSSRRFDFLAGFPHQFTILAGGFNDGLAVDGVNPNAVKDARKVLGCRLRSAPGHGVGIAGRAIKVEFLHLGCRIAWLG